MSFPSLLRPAKFGMYEVRCGEVALGTAIVFVAVFRLRPTDEWKAPPSMGYLKAVFCDEKKHLSANVRLPADQEELATVLRLAESGCASFGGVV